LPLQLHDGKLELDHILDIDFPKAKFVYLSACETAMGDEKLANEAMHLAGGFIAAGFQGAIWSMSDADGPKVAETVYQTILGQDNIPEVIRAAKGLHLAIQKLRKESAPLHQWMPFIHMGIWCTVPFQSICQALWHVTTLTRIWKPQKQPFWAGFGFLQCEGLSKIFGTCDKCDILFFQRALWHVTDKLNEMGQYHVWQIFWANWMQDCNFWHATEVCMFLVREKYILLSAMHWSSIVRSHL
jgi:hypothetical protein